MKQVLACLSEDDHSSNAIKLALVGGTNRNTLLPLTHSNKTLVQNTNNYMNLLDRKEDEKIYKKKLLVLDRILK